MSLVTLAEADEQDALNDYIEAQVHGDAVRVSGPSREELQQRAVVGLSESRGTRRIGRGSTGSRSRVRAAADAVAIL